MWNYCGRPTGTVVAMMMVAGTLMSLQTSSANETTRKECRMLKCAPYCKPGNGSDGCPICDCPPIPSCENFTCDDPGYVCELIQVQCFTTPCYPRPTCVRAPETTTECPMIKCAPNCQPDKGSDGCPTCFCPPSCQTVKCSAGYECKLVNVTCVEESPCYPQPQCVPTKKSDDCSGTPNIRRCSGIWNFRWTYNSKTDTCKRILHGGCTASSNTFSNQTDCERRCKTKATGCKPVSCPDGCTVTTRGKSKCARCICRDPCKKLACPDGYKCKLQFLRKPYCAPIICPEQPPCNIRCSPMTPLMKDANGCQLCQCQKKPRP